MAVRFTNTTRKGKFDYKTNEHINGYDTVRLIYKEHSSEASENDFNRVMSMSEARELSREKSLDLIEINSSVTPPIIRLCDYSKFIWEQKKKEKSRNKNTTTLKEIQLKATIAENDLETKARAALKFLESGFKVKVVLTLRGRENTRKEYSKGVFYRFLELVGDDAVFELKPKDEGNKTITIIRKK